MPPQNFFSAADFFKDDYWHQRWEVFPGIFTPGNNPVSDLCKYIQLPISPETLGMFDLVLFLGVLYHLRYPFLAIDRLRSVSKKTVLIETHVVNNRRLLRKPYSIIGRFLPLSLLFKSTPIWRQYREFELHPEDQSNWFGPNIQAVTESFETAGFDIVHLSSWAADRAVFRAEAKDERPARFAANYEGLAAAEGLSLAHAEGL